MDTKWKSNLGEKIYNQDGVKLDDCRIEAEKGKKEIPNPRFLVRFQDFENRFATRCFGIVFYMSQANRLSDRPTYKKHKVEFN